MTGAGETDIKERILGYKATMHHGRWHVSHAWPPQLHMVDGASVMHRMIEIIWELHWFLLQAPNSPALHRRLPSLPLLPN